MTTIDKKNNFRLLILWVTTDCNLRCQYCYARGGEHPRNMKWNVAKAALDFMAESSENFKIQFAGGEPLLNLDLVEKIVDYTKGWPVSFQLQTNATLIDISTARSLSQMGISVGVSMDGFPTVNDTLRPLANGNGSTAAAIAGIEILRAIGIRIGLTCVVSNENIRYLADLINLASYLGNIEGISLDMLRPVGRALENGILPPDPDQTERCVSDALQRADRVAAMGGNPVKFREVERIRSLLSSGTNRKYRCYFDGGQSLMINPEGGAWPCASLSGFPGFSLGNILNDSFKPQIRHRLKRVQQHCYIPRGCLDCSDWELCGGPCPAQVYTQQIYGRGSSAECAMRTAFIDYVRSKGKSDDESKKTCISV